ncbi:Hypothetical_protein [Hexamita inflata]|uniref:Hypothetical_protein n=1 Tax=Hexamita inflata TaxID=28002 RepID=A0AA86NSS9_9EUKA|nr:Hypothetical protein HINF_LOCUS12144 [Hexamita inflata]
MTEHSIPPEAVQKVKDILATDTSQNINYRQICQYFASAGKNSAEITDKNTVQLITHLNVIRKEYKMSAANFSKYLYEQIQELYGSFPQIPQSARASNKLNNDSMKSDRKLDSKNGSQIIITELLPIPNKKNTTEQSQLQSSQESRAFRGRPEQLDSKLQTPRMKSERTMSMEKISKRKKRGHDDESEMSGESRGPEITKSKLINDSKDSNSHRRSKSSSKRNKTEEDDKNAIKTDSYKELLVALDQQEPIQTQEPLPELESQLKQYQQQYNTKEKQTVVQIEQTNVIEKTNQKFDKNEEISTAKEPAIIHSEEISTIKDTLIETHNDDKNETPKEKRSASKSEKSVSKSNDLKKNDKPIISNNTDLTEEERRQMMRIHTIAMETEEDLRNAQSSNEKAQNQQQPLEQQNKPDEDDFDNSTEQKEIIDDKKLYLEKQPLTNIKYEQKVNDIHYSQDSTVQLNLRYSESESENLNAQNITNFEQNVQSKQVTKHQENENILSSTEVEQVDKTKVIKEIYSFNSDSTDKKRNSSVSDHQHAQITSNIYKSGLQQQLAPVNIQEHAYDDLSYDMHQNNSVATVREEESNVKNSGPVTRNTSNASINGNNNLNNIQSLKGIDKNSFGKNHEIQNTSEIYVLDNENQLRTIESTKDLKLKDQTNISMLSKLSETPIDQSKLSISSYTNIQPMKEQKVAIYTAIPNQSEISIDNCSVGTQTPARDIALDNAILTLQLREMKEEKNKIETEKFKLYNDIKKIQNKFDKYRKDAVILEQKLKRQAVEDKDKSVFLQQSLNQIQQLNQEEIQKMREQSDIIKKELNQKNNEVQSVYEQFDQVKKQYEVDAHNLRNKFAKEKDQYVAKIGQLSLQLSEKCQQIEELQQQCQRAEVETNISQNDLTNLNFNYQKRIDEIKQQYELQLSDIIKNANGNTSQIFEKIRNEAQQDQLNSRTQIIKLNETINSQEKNLLSKNALIDQMIKQRNELELQIESDNEVIQSFKSQQHILQNAQETELKMKNSIKVIQNYKQEIQELKQIIKNQKSQIDKLQNDNTQITLQLTEINQQQAIQKSQMNISQTENKLTPTQMDDLELTTSKLKVSQNMVNKLQNQIVELKKSLVQTEMEKDYQYVLGLQKMCATDKRLKQTRNVKTMLK